MTKPIPFGKYVLLDRINVGGMAEVFKAKAFGVEGFERLVAVKRILPNIAEDKEFITMFIDEAKIAVQLTHANIAQIFDLGKVDGSYFIALEYVHGKDLRTLVDRAHGKPEGVPIPLASFVVMKACEGLDYAHNKKDAAGRELHLVHRDVSPQNILVSYDGDVKVIDFGIAKAAGKAGKTQAGILKGKFAYMSPEQVRGLPLDRRSDIFAVGIVLYELLTGQRLFVGDSDFSTLEKVRNVEIIPPSTHNRRIPAELEKIVLKALAPDPDDRYKSAMDLHDELQSFMYTSGNLFARKDLGAFMHAMFAEEIAKESIENETLAKAASAPSGLAAFDAIPSGGSSPPPPAARQQKATMLGMGVPPPPGRPSKPPPPPPPEHASQPTVPPPRAAQSQTTPPAAVAAPAPEKAAAAPAPNPPPVAPPKPPAVQASPAPQAQASPPLQASATTPSQGKGPTEASTGGVPSLEVDWDEEELSTKVYDRPEAMLAAAEHQLSGGDASSGMRDTPVSPAPAVVLQAPAAPPVSPTAPVTANPSAAPVVAASATADTPKKKSVSPLLFAAGGLVLIAAVGAGGYFFALRGQIAPSLPPSVTPEVTPESRSKQPGSIAPTPTDTPAVPSSPQNTPPVVPAADPPAVPTVEETAPSPATGFTLDTEPSGAQVWVDGKELPSRTPVSVSDLTAGTHLIRVEAGSRYDAWQTRIEVPQGQIVAVPRPVLSLRAVTVAFASTPAGAEVTLVRGRDRRSLGTTPVEADVELTGGAWEVELSKDGYETRRETLALSPEQPTTAFEASLTERARTTTHETTRTHTARHTTRTPSEASQGGSGATSSGTSTTTATDTASPARGGNGTLRINTRPWSQVFVDGRLIGNTPQMNISVAAGNHRVTFVNPDFNIRQTISVSVEAGQTVTRVETLTPGP